MYLRMFCYLLISFIYPVDDKPQGKEQQTTTCWHQGTKANGDEHIVIVGSCAYVFLSGINRMFLWVNERSTEETIFVITIPLHHTYIGRIIMWESRVMLILDTQLFRAFLDTNSFLVWMETTFLPHDYLHNRYKKIFFFKTFFSLPVLC